MEHVRIGGNMDNLNQIWNKYKGAIIGAIIALLILFTRLYAVVIGIILIIICVYLGNYIQQNKYEVKEKLKSFIDKI